MRSIARPTDTDQPVRTALPCNDIRLGIELGEHHITTSWRKDLGSDNGVDRIYSSGDLIEMTKTVHPAIGVLALRRITFTQAAKGTGYGPRYVSRVLTGIYPVTSEFRARLTAYLGEPEDRLFLREVVSR